MGSGLEEQDLHDCIATLVREELIDGIVLPKVESCDHVNNLSR
jgi:hypothetical protein